MEEGTDENMSSDWYTVQDEQGVEGEEYADDEDQGLQYRQSQLDSAFERARFKYERQESMGTIIRKAAQVSGSRCPYTMSHH